jgi:hypothetical protein
MSKYKNKTLFLILGVAFLIFSSCGKSTQESTDIPPEFKSTPKFVKVTIPSGTALAITFSDTIQTNKNQAGDQFAATLTQPAVVEGRELLPAGSHVSMVITGLIKGGTLKTAPEMAFTITDITLPSGKRYVVEVDTFYEKGRSHATREAVMIGGGAAVGAVIGGVLGNVKGAIIGAAAGGAAGTGAAAATGRQNLIYPAGMTFEFTLQEPMAFYVPIKDLVKTTS